eukprot:940394-Pelagomonas_calceolata.AAC.3
MAGWCSRVSCDLGMRGLLEGEIPGSITFGRYVRILFKLYIKYLESSAQELSIGMYMGPIGRGQRVLTLWDSPLNFLWATSTEFLMHHMIPELKPCPAASFSELESKRAGQCAWL